VFGDVAVFRENDSIKLCESFDHFVRRPIVDVLSVVEDYEIVNDFEDFEGRLVDGADDCSSFARWS
jgi:hypothetical protein